MLNRLKQNKICKLEINEVQSVTKVYYVRHAEPNYNNHNDALRELTPKGLNDRKLVTKFWADKEINVAVSSPFQRAVDTIKEFTDLEGIKIEVIDGKMKYITERIDEE